MSLDDIRNNYSDPLNSTRIELLDDYLTFTRALYKIKTGREFRMSEPVGNISHFIEVANALMDVFEGKTKRLYIGLPPGWGKSIMCKFFVTWCFAHYGDCRFLYISHSHDLASMHTHEIREIMNMPIFKKLFNIEIRRDSSAKDYFLTTDGGAVAAFGSAGGITGHDAGLPGLNRFSGAVIIDDVHKPDEVHSDTIRGKVKKNYFETIERRLRGPNVPVIMIGQRLHEDDLAAHLLSGADGCIWEKVIIQSLDENNHARYPEMNSRTQLLGMKQTQPYVFASQYQQNPIPSGGALYKREWFPILDKDPDIIATFVTCDTAETDKQYNDSTVFSFWGLYKIDFNGEKIDDLYGLHWIDCHEIRVEPKDLEPEFRDFYTSCMRYKVKPQYAAIEKKSTGVTLASILNSIPGLKLINIDRKGFEYGDVNSKSNRFIAIQQYISQRLITFSLGSGHVEKCISHMTKITANDTHRHDDIADTAYDAVKMALVDRIIINKEQSGVNYNDMAKSIMSPYQNIDRLRSKAFG